MSMLTLATILKLKRTQGTDFPGPMGWREIGKRLGMTGQGAHAQAKKHLNGVPRCPCCLRRLEKLSEEEKDL